MIIIFSYVECILQVMMDLKKTVDTLELEKDKGTDYVLSWILKAVYSSKLKPLYTAFLHGI